MFFFEQVKEAFSSNGLTGINDVLIKNLSPGSIKADTVIVYNENANILPLNESTVVSTLQKGNTNILPVDTNKITVFKISSWTKFLFELLNHIFFKYLTNKDDDNSSSTFSSTTTTKIVITTNEISTNTTTTLPFITTTVYFAIYFSINDTFTSDLNDGSSNAYLILINKINLFVN